MKKTLGRLCIVLLLGIGQAAWAAESCEELRAAQVRLEANKKAATEFFQLILGDLNYEKARTYAGEYIQHDPRVAGNGVEVLIHYLKTDPKFKNRPRTKIVFHNLMADGNLVSFQTRKEFKDPGDGSLVRLLVQHTFRFDAQGKIAEHWTQSSRVTMNSSKNLHSLW
ncbi:MAG: nuclear transport factor 2 family protein [Desulfoplanes sp.]|nr:nuclear transport factor 2 family protein [Desulfoplanes sp.]MDD4650289.1 nuclear transport factor 2 family protein [Desulfoplanes sp.]